MQATPGQIQTWASPGAHDVGSDYVDFLKRMGQPTWITLPGKDSSRRRAIVTLLHGNEPSGLKAIHRFIQSGQRPAVDTGILIASVPAALKEPFFSHRYLPGEEDLNRCFNPPWDTLQREFAREALDLLADFAPEAVVDTHNTSGHSVAFAVATSDDQRTLALSAGFTDNLVVLDLRLGTLIEQRDRLGSVVTIEFGGFLDPNADSLAFESLSRFLNAGGLFDGAGSPSIILRHPHRLEIRDDTEIHYSSTVQDAADITMFNTIDQMNFTRVEAGSPLGWTGSGGLEHFRIVSADGEDLVPSFLAESDGFVVAAQPITLFMATTDPFVAKSDCLLYLTPAQ
ncbi:MAG: succinylglutamate desuccinylase/aspartoacylase family protein [Pseudomonadales bacterium]|nr:succinylglutamate desuccinylase/aspartoacylase family protein [Pseudomonadales bacterium]